MLLSAASKSLDSIKEINLNSLKMAPLHTKKNTKPKISALLAGLEILFETMSLNYSKELKYMFKGCKCPKVCTFVTQE